jgi:hypothetical protein
VSKSPQDQNFGDSSVFVSTSKAILWESRLGIDSARSPGAVMLQGIALGKVKMSAINVSLIVGSLLKSTKIQDVPIQV